MSSSGRLIVQGSISAIEQPDIAFGSGASFTSGFGQLFEQPDTLISNGRIRISGDVFTFETPDTGIAIGKVTVLGQGNLVELTDGLSSTGCVLISGTISVIEPPDTAFGTGGAFVPITGTAILVESSSDVLSSKYIDDGYIEEGYFELKESVFSKVLVQADFVSVSEDGTDSSISTGRIPIQTAIQLQEDPDTLLVIGEIPVFGFIDIVESGLDIANGEHSAIPGSTYKRIGIKSETKRIDAVSETPSRIVVSLNRTKRIVLI